jgi:phosphoenolpyruvate carboxykinase (GTP)
LISKANNYLTGIFYGATLSSEETSASVEGIQGNIRFDPMSMKPFIGYNIDNYLSHSLNLIGGLQIKPNFYLVNWFRKDPNGKFIWDGFGSNAIIFKWIFENNDSNKIDGFFGSNPTPNDLNIDQKKWNKLFLDPSNNIFNYIDLVNNYIETFNNFPKELKEIFIDLKNKI